MAISISGSEVWGAGSVVWALGSAVLKEGSIGIVFLNFFLLNKMVIGALVGFEMDETERMFQSHLY